MLLIAAKYFYKSKPFTSTLSFIQIEIHLANFKPIYYELGHPGL